PNVVTVYDEGRDGDDSFMVMEFVRGKTLRDVVRERGPLPSHEAARLVSQIAAALDAAHEAGVIHCDVKPANVIADERGTALRTARVGVSEQIDEVVRRALAREPSQRYERAGTFARALLAASERGDATGVLTPPPPRPLRAGRGRQIDSTVALLAVIAVLVGTLIVFASFQGRATTSATAAPARSAAVTTTPSVVGKDVIEAGNILIAAGFRAPVGWEVDSAARGTPCTVARQQPAANTQFQRGDTAHLFLVGGKDCGKKPD